MYTRLTSVHVDEEPSLWSNDRGVHGIHAVNARSQYEPAVHALHVVAPWAENLPV
jgi:hypothetical protein